MKIPRDVSGEQLVKVLKKFGYEKIRQSGSHIRLVRKTTEKKYNLTVPNHNPIKTGTLNKILSDLAEQLKMSKEELLENLISII
jgi:predicted RNA binding protein YcfA (HicA-like mRNA interferase family)